VTKGIPAGRAKGSAATASFGQTKPHARLPKLVLLPGLHGTAGLLDDFRAALGADVEVQVVEYPRDQVLDHAQLAALVRPRLPLGRPFVLLGESFSGPVALLLAAQHPPGLRGLVLSTTFASGPRPSLAGLAHYARALPASAMPMWLVSFWLLGKWATPKLRERFAQVLHEVSPDVLTERFIACAGVDVRETLPKINVPVLYLRARRDRLVPPTAGEQVAAGAKQVRILDFDAPHCLLQAIPAQAARVVREFAGVLPGGRG
jgi:pimeloyl-ACP methyl ester carboxylesterase